MMEPPLSNEEESKKTEAVDSLVGCFLEEFQSKIHLLDFLTEGGLRGWVATGNPRVCSGNLTNPF